MVHFILVHGTFARGARWTRVNSQLRLALRECMNGDVTFSQSVWSGRNSNRDRKAGVERLNRAIERARRECPGEPLVLAGHSHGGSVIAHYLRASSADPASVRRAIFLSVPFYAVRTDDSAIKVIPYLVAAFFLLCAPIGLSLAAWSYVASDWPDDLVGAIIMQLLIPPIFFLLVPAATFGGSLFALLIWWRRITTRLYRAILRRVRRQVADLETCILPPGRYLFARVVGDEVAAGLLSGVTLLRVVRAGWQLVANPIRDWARRLYHPGRPSVGSVVLAVAASFGMCELVLAGFVAFVSAPNGWWEELSASPFAILAFVAAYPQWCVLAVAGLFGLLLAGLFGVLLLALSILVPLGLLATFSLGSMSLTMSLFARFSVEPAPIGAERFVTLSWEDQPGIVRRLSHSRVHAVTSLAAVIASWLAEELNDA